MYTLQKQCKQIKLESRESGRILFDLNEDTRSDCLKGLIECKKKLNMFEELIEYLDNQTSEARKVVFDKNNQIGKYFNQVKEYQQKVEGLGKLVTVVILEKLNLLY